MLKKRLLSIGLALSMSLSATILSSASDITVGASGDSSSSDSFFLIPWVTTKSKV